MGDTGSGGDGEILDIKIADLKATAPHFHTHSTDLAKALTKLRTSLAAAGSPWGDDKQGTEFHQSYGPQVTKMENAAGILSQGLDSIHDAMVDMADGHIDNEDLVRSMFSKIQPRPGDGGGHAK
ncbi:WXG100 family type VII secretion target [Streptomyces sp. NPDC102467]|uniref:WXG100 family type VII secretion target n=1 Tax=Streptomyces sp. NPDC102467 TaxID=3366179 RepID=UPI003828C32C